MNTKLFVNDLIEWKLENNSLLLERILWIDEGYVIAFVLDINAAKGLPTTKNVSEILEAISEGLALKQPQDPWLRIIKEENLTDREKEYRDKAWEIIFPLVTQEPSIYYRNFRGVLVKQVVEKYNEVREKDKLVEKTVYGYLRKFWQRGKTQNALIPDFINSSGKGKIRGYSDKKRGRPRKYASEIEIGEGINITEEDRKIFRIAISRYYNNSKKNYLNTAYELMVKEFYKEDIRYDADGVKKSILIPIDKIPTLTQFKYWYQLEQDDITKTLKSRKGTKKFALENRAILGTSKMETIGPGSRYQIDATIADIYLVSSYNRNWIIGRPVIYVIIDVFSRMITGIYVGLEGPSWIGAMMALANVASDKVKFCSEHNIDITEDEWCCNQMPDAILGDRGELAGMKVETLIPNLHIRIENAASYRADWKGLVERRFRIINEGYIKPFLPGYVDKDFGERGTRDYRLDGKLNIEEFTAIVIRLILDHNNHKLLDYERDTAMIVDDVSSIPTELWKWGISNRSGRLRTFPEDIVKLNLMPTEKATITPKGIKLKGKEMYYTSDRARREQWFEKARSNLLSKSEKYLVISYDIRNLNYIYLPSEDGRYFETCYLIDHEGRYLNKNFHDIEYLLAYEELQKQKYRGQQLQQKVDLIAEIENIVNKAEKIAEDAQDDNLSKSKKLAGIRENRSTEKSRRRENEGFELKSEENLITSNTLETQQGEKEETEVKAKSLKPNHLDILRQARLERQNGDKK
jgi:hypothetical protein